MGLTEHELRLLRGRALGRVLTLGRQSVPEFGDGVFLDSPAVAASLGITAVVSVDASAFEGATVIHDLNEPLPPSVTGFDTVIDGGTLEHVFNLPIALASCMRALKVGGRFLGVNPCNNLVGHGFYQFSPEFFYRVFSEANGFRVDVCEVQESDAVSVEHGYRRARYTAIDPAATGERGTLVTTRPLMIRVVATKIADVEPFTRWPQQSDYVRVWAGVRRQQNTHRLLSLLPRFLRDRLTHWRTRQISGLSNRRHFTPR